MVSIFGVCCWYVLYHKDKIGDIDTLISYPLNKFIFSLILMISENNIYTNN